MRIKSSIRFLRFSAARAHLRALLGKQRIEIDSLLALAGARRLWEYLKEKMEALAPLRDLNRSIDCEIVLPEEYQAVLSELSSILSEAAFEKSEKYMRVLREWHHGFVPVDEQEKVIREDLTSIIEDSSRYHQALDAMRTLLDNLKKL
jgi:hypothetical protein